MPFHASRGDLLRANALTSSELMEYFKLRNFGGRTISPAYRTASGTLANPQRRRLAAWLDEPITFLRADTLFESIKRRFSRGI